MVAENMPKNAATSKTKNSICFRLSPEQMEALASTVRHRAPGMSLDLYAQAVLLEHLGEAPKSEGLPGVQKDVQNLRSELALAVEVLLAQSSGAIEPISAEQARAWVRQNFKLSENVP
jgi:hypothetical protein